MNSYQQAACQISRSKLLVALTGAGISVESGIPDFRSAKGLWSKYDPVEFGYIESFRANPAKVWKMLLELDALLTDALPNPAHYALAELERRGILQCIVTQNVDSLHQRAGSINVVEFHGSNRTLRCDSCGMQLHREEISFVNIPPLCTCKGVIRPELVFFGEMIPPEALQNATRAAQQCDTMVVIGTSASVAPASTIPKIAKQHGAYLLEINPQGSELTHRLTDLHLAERAGIALPAIIKALDELNPLHRI